MDRKAADPRDYPRLFRAMNEVLRALSADANEEDALRRSFEDAARGFGAEKALLLLVEEQQPVRLRGVHVRGLTEEQTRACERGESAKGVSASVIRAVIQSRKPRLIENPLFQQDDERTPALAGHNYSVLCAPVLDPLRDLVLAVMYFQNGALDPAHAYDADDLVWLEGYASVLGQAFALYFQRQRREYELEELLQGVTPPEDAPELIGDSAATQALRRELHEVYIPASEAPDPDPLLILGEKGTGKDLVARYLHAYGARRDRSFVAVSCAEITDELAAGRLFGHKKGAFTGALADEPGLFRAAHGGVLFLDEIGDLGVKAQGTLLRVLENRTVVPLGETREVRVDVQVLLATNRNLGQAVAEGLLRPDLLDRFQTQVIRLPPVRERPWDIPPLLQHFLAHHERRMRKKTLGLTPGARRAMLSYSWPGNVRELGRVCSLLVTHARPGAHLDEALLQRCYPDLMSSAPNPKSGPLLWEDARMRSALRDFKRELILSRLERHHWNVRAARESLGLAKTTFHRHLTALGIRAPGSQAPPAPEE
jgi:transcriptional regulator with GAF, ATPase, and Fis domain